MKKNSMLMAGFGSGHGLIARDHAHTKRIIILR